MYLYTLNFLSSLFYIFFLKVVGAGKPYYVAYIKDLVRDRVVDDMGLRSYDCLQYAIMENQCAIDFLMEENILLLLL